MADLKLGDSGPDSTTKHDEKTPDGMEELFMFSPWTQSGEVTFFNWLNADVSGYDGIEVSAKGSAPGWSGPMFSKLPSNATFATDRPDAYHGKNATGSPDKIFIAGKDKIEDLFMHTYNDIVRWEMCWRGHYSKGSGGKWYQYFNGGVYNTTDVLYPFATKGVSFRLRVPKGNEETMAKGVGDDSNYGDHMQISRAWGLWRDLDGAYYIYRMYAHGDNRYKAYGSSDQSGTEEDGEEGDDDEGSKVRPKKGSGGTTKRYPDRVKPKTIEWWGERYWFIDEDNIPVEKTHDALQKQMVKEGGEKGLVMMTNENVENLYFCGFSIEIHHDRSAGSKRNHSYLISRLTPIPFYSPRHSPSIKAVLGQPTPITELREGHKKLHFWNPPNKYYSWTDDLSYLEEAPDDNPEKDSVNGDGDTIEMASDEIFVDTNGDGIAVPSSVFLTDDNNIIVNGKGEVITVDDSEYIIQSIQDAYSDSEDESN